MKNGSENGSGKDRDFMEQSMEQKKKIKTKVISQTEIADGIYDMWIDTDLAKTAKARIFAARLSPEFPVNFFQPWGTIGGR